MREVRELLVLPELAEASPVRECLMLLAMYGAGGDGGKYGAPGGASGGVYGALYRALIDRALAAGWGLEPAEAQPGASLLTLAVADAVLSEETTLSRWVERTRAAGAPLAAPLMAAAAADLRTLQALVRELDRVQAALAPQAHPKSKVQSGELGGVRADSGLVGSGAADVGAMALPVAVVGEGRCAPLLEQLVGSDDWGALAAELAAYYATHGAGAFAQHRAFRWLGPDAVRLPGSTGMGALGGLGALAPVPAPDAVGPDDLVGYEAERALLRRNTAQFLAGFPANNVLLYGDRGTGKSSSVKALLNERSREGEPEGLWDALRIVEVPKARLTDFPVLAELLRTKPQRFILFVDDLSFEEGETQYKEMKAMLEGGLEARPANVVVYATSNRRHLIREQFADRASPGSDEVHARDTVQEKLSFADRFGVTITFPTPDQAAYLAIVEGLAQRRGLLAAPPPPAAFQDGRPVRSAQGGLQTLRSARGQAPDATIERQALRARAIEWATWHNGRSGRTAKQFVDYLEGEFGVMSKER